MSALSWRAKRRLLYLILALSVSAGLGVAFFIVNKPVPTCFDGKQNQNELGIDCGGSCGQVCPFEVRDVRVVWARIFSIASDKYDAAAFVQNPNSRHGVRSFKYLFKVFDAENLLIDTRRGSTFLNPQEGLVVFESRLQVGQRTPVRVIFELEEAPAWQKIDRQAPKVSVERKSLVVEPIPKLTATVTNSSLMPLKDLVVVVLLAGELQNAVAVSSTLIEELRPGERKEVVYTWPAPFAQRIVTVDFYTHLDLAKLPPPS